MDLFGNNQTTEKEQNRGREQLALDFDAPSGSGTETPAPPSFSFVAPENHPEEKPVKEKKKSGKRKARSEPQGQPAPAEETEHFGKYLQDMRVKNNYSLIQVEQLTRIKKKYIELLEMEKLVSELPSVYVLAYVRKLCACYQVPADKMTAIISELKSQLDNYAPAELIENIHLDHEIDENSQKKLRHLAWLVLGTLFFLAVLIGIAGFMLVAPAKKTAVIPSGPVTAGEKFNPEKLDTLQPPVIFEATELPPKTAP